MINAITPYREEQNDTKLSYDGLDFHKRLWIDTSIQNGELTISKLAEHCSLVTKESAHTWRKRFYTWKHRLPDFEEVWLLYFERHYKKHVQTKIYARLAQLIDREKDISKLAKLLEVIETKGTQTTENLLVEVIEEQRERYGIGIKDVEGKTVEI